MKTNFTNKEPRLQGGALKPKFSKPKIEIPKQVRDDSETGTKPYCHAELVSASPVSASHSFLLVSESHSFSVVSATL
jgi:hypothetical protein